MALKQKIALILGFGFVVYSYASIDKTYFDFVGQMFYMTLLAIIMELVIKYVKDRSYIAILAIMMLCVGYAMVKQVLNIGSKYVLADYIMWIVVPILFVSVIVYFIVKALNNGSK